MTLRELEHKTATVERDLENGQYKVNHAYRNTVDRFWSLVEKDGPGGCWIWKGSISKRGYGRYCLYGVCYQAHRLSYLLAHGAIDESLTIDHLCRNHSCVNPKHLELVTVKENNLRGAGIMALNARKTHCRHGHPFSGKNLYMVKIKSKDGNIRYWRRCLKCTYVINKRVGRRKTMEAVCR